MRIPTRPQSGDLYLRFVSDESGGNPVARIHIEYDLSDALPDVSWNPANLETGVSYNSTRHESLTLKNAGLASLTEARVNLFTEDGGATAGLDFPSRPRRTSAF